MSIEANDTFVRAEYILAYIHPKLIIPGPVLPLIVNRIVTIFLPALPNPLYHEAYLVIEDEGCVNKSHQLHWG